MGGKEKDTDIVYCVRKPDGNLSGLSKYINIFGASEADQVPYGSFALKK